MAHPNPSRRRFIQGSALAVASSAPLSALIHRTARGAGRSEGYGVPAPTACEATGFKLLRLPPDFRYFSYGWTGEPMDDGIATPSRHDGMAVVAQEGPRLHLVRNHEVVSDSGAYGDPAINYDPAAGGGTSNLVFDLEQEAFTDARASLSGTLANCCGGPTPWGSWLTCEELVVDAHQEVDRGNGPVRTALERDHGFVFDVPVAGTSQPRPLHALGRFAHEAVAVHEPSGTVYLTEDRHPDAGFYRTVPNEIGNLPAGGRLQMACIAGREQMISNIPAGRWFDVDWVDIEDPIRAHTPGTTDGGGVLGQGLAAGGTPFRRLEGCWADGNRVFFTSTSGGNAGFGQVFELDCAQQRLRLVFESPSREVLDYPDNLTVSPRGGLLLCEDGSRQGQRLAGLDAAGDLFVFAVNDVVLRPGQHPRHEGDFRGSEWCGACFSPDGRWLFVNLQKPGITFAITGPWKEGLI